MKEYTKGRIELILGPMFCGKTTELLRRVKRFEIAKKKVLLLKYSLDTRYSKECISTHDSKMVPAIPTKKLKPFLQTAAKYDCIGIDEGQFFGDINDFCEAVANMGKVVIVAALDGTFERKPFGQILNLIPKAEKVVKLNAVCVHCGNDAAFSHRTSEIKETVVIGGEDKYIAVCRECFLNK